MSDELYNIYDITKHAKRRISKPAVYGDAQEQFHVKQGDIWKGINGTYICADVTTLNLPELINDKISFVYTDPPWTPSMYSNFYRNAKLDIMEIFPTFITNLAQQIKSISNGVVFLECGMPYYEMVISRLEFVGATTFGIEHASYGQEKIPYVVWRGTFTDGIADPGETGVDVDLTSAESERRVQAMIKRSDTFLDTLCGEMKFLKRALLLGIPTYGVEFIPRKFAKGLRYVTQFDGAPVKVANIYE